MKGAAHILLVGNDGRLLNERAAVLFNFWSIAAIATFDDDLRPLHWSDLLVLCHTVTDAQREGWILRSRTERPGRPIVSIDYSEPAGLPGATHKNGADALVGHERGPAALVSSIYELLTERGLGSKQWIHGGRTLLGADGLPEMGRE